METKQGTLHVYEAGTLTVLGFGGQDALDAFNVAQCHEELMELVETYQCEVLAVDLTGVTLIPSGLLGLLASMRNHEIEVHLYNPSDDIREVMDITNLKDVMPMHEVEV